MEPRESLDVAIIGTYNGRLVYLYDTLVPAFVEMFRQSNPEASDRELQDLALDWVDYNVIGSLASLDMKTDLPLLVLEYKHDIHADLEENLIIVEGIQYLAL
jgi:hypothetical protein